MELSEIKVDIKRTLGELLVVGTSKPVPVYVDGKPTDEIAAQLYPVLSTQTWKQYNAKVAEKKPSIEYSGQPIPVNLINLDAKLWQDYKSKEVRMSISADAIELVQNQKIKINKGEKINEV